MVPALVINISWEPLKAALSVFALAGMHTGGSAKGNGYAEKLTSGP